MNVCELSKFGRWCDQIPSLVIWEIMMNMLNRGKRTCVKRAHTKLIAFRVINLGPMSPIFYRRSQILLIPRTLRRRWGSAGLASLPWAPNKFSLATSWQTAKTVQRLIRSATPLTKFVRSLEKRMKQEIVELTWASMVCRKDPKWPGRRVSSKNGT